MTIMRKRYIKLWIVTAIAVIFWTVGAGFYRDLSAGNEETYKGLKLFSDVPMSFTESRRFMRMPAPDPFNFTERESASAMTETSVTFSPGRSGISVGVRLS